MLLSKVKGTKEVKKVSSYIIFAITFLIVMVMACSDLIFGEGMKISLSNMGLIQYILF